MRATSGREVNYGHPMDVGIGILEGQGREGRLVYCRVERPPVGDCGGYDWRSLGGREGASLGRR